MGQNNPVSNVNLLIGTETFEDEEYLGHTPAGGYFSYYGSVIPGPRTPNREYRDGQVSPITSFRGYAHARGSGYRYKDSSIMGFVQRSHQDSRNANISFMPMIGVLKTNPGTLDNPDNGYRSRKDFKTEIAKPNYYSVFLKDYNIKAEFTINDNAAFHRYSFPASDKARILIDLSVSQDTVKNAYISVDDSLHVSGWQKAGSGTNTYTIYFYAKFNKPFASYGTWKKEDLNPSNNELSGKKVGAYLNYRTSDREKVQVKVGISSRSIHEAKFKVEEGTSGWNFKKMATETANKWNNLLSRIQVEGGTENQRALFYTSLVRSLSFESTGSWAIPTGLVKLLVQPERFKAYLGGLKWNSLDGSFWGAGVTPNILGFYRRGVIHLDLESAYKEYINLNNWRSRRDYNKWGYIPYTPYTKSYSTNKYNENFFTDVVNRTLGYAYADYCMAIIAKILGKERGYRNLMKSSANYRNLFDPESGFFRPRDASGKWLIEKFNPAKPRHHIFYREGNAWQWLWLVPHNIDDLIQLLGGKEEFISKLDDFFSIPYDPEKPAETIKNVYKGKGVVDVSGMIGQYCHGNETDRYVPYYYNFAGQPWKTQKIIREILNKLYKAKPGGLSGMDDWGGLSSWYIFSSMGFYPVRPELPIYQIGSPIFKKVTINNANRGTTFVIRAKNVSKKNKYIHSATLNGEPLHKPWFTHSDILEGGKLVLQMGPSPNKKWGSDSETIFHSLFMSFKDQYLNP